MQAIKQHNTSTQSAEAAMQRHSIIRALRLTALHTNESALSFMCFRQKSNGHHSSCRCSLLRRHNRVLHALQAKPLPPHWLTPAR